jgi:hypothetical protein
MKQDSMVRGARSASCDHLSELSVFILGQCDYRALVIMAV